MLQDILKIDGILLEIKTEELPELAKIYEKHQDWIPHAYSTIMTGIDWAKKSKEQYMLFMSPGNCWREDGTFFVLMRFSCNNLCVFTLDKTAKNVVKGIFKSDILKNIKRYTNNEEIMFFDIHNRIYPRVLENISTKIKEDNYQIFCLLKERAIEFEILCPTDVYINELDIALASLINSYWPHKYPGSEKYIEKLIEMSGGFGVFLKSTHQLVSCVIISGIGQLSTLQTLNGFKRKGYGKLILKKGCIELAKRGFNSYGSIVIGNKVSENMFNELGFKNIGTCKCFFL